MKLPFLYLNLVFWLKHLENVVDRRLLYKQTLSAILVSRLFSVLSWYITIFYMYYIIYSRANVNQNRDSTLYLWDEWTEKIKNAE